MTFNLAPPEASGVASPGRFPALAPRGAAALLFVALGLVGAIEGGCGPAQSPIGEPPIALVHQRQCGRCHRLPEVGKHPRPYLEEALAPHRKRVRLTDAEWAELIDYLAARPTGG